MLCIGSAPRTNQTLGTRYLTIGIGGQLQATAGSVVDAGLAGIHQIPV